MEKATAHYDLAALQARVTELGASAFTRTALDGIDAMGLTLADGIAVVCALQRTMLIKSMTTHADHRVWQDVYHAPCAHGLTAYIKLTLRDNGAPVIQFKER